MDTKQQKYIEQIREYEKLVGWQSNNHLVVKMTTDKFHRKLNKIIRLYKADINESIHSIKDIYQNMDIKSDIPSFY